MATPVILSAAKDLPQVIREQILRVAQDDIRVIRHG
jgi:hypothetical protein